MVSLCLLLQLLCNQSITHDQRIDIDVRLTWSTMQMYCAGGRFSWLWDKDHIRGEEIDFQIDLIFFEINIFNQADYWKCYYSNQDILKHINQCGDFRPDFYERYINPEHIQCGYHRGKLW